jgi:hypothetical protein
VAPEEVLARPVRVGRALRECSRRRQRRIRHGLRPQPTQQRVEAALGSPGA